MRYRRWLNSLWARRPRGIWHWLSVIAVWAVLGCYLSHWLAGNWVYLTDPDWQTDDVRTALFPFHRYGPEHALANDPIASEMLDYIPPLVKGLYRVVVPWCGLFLASKVSQALCLGIIVWAGLLLATRKRTGLAIAALLVFLFLRDSFVIACIASGLPRAFGFPSLALWAAGALAHRVKVRRVAIVLAALSYPSALALLLAGEGLLVSSGLFRKSRASLVRTGRGIFVTGLLALVAVTPTLMSGDPKDGKIDTLEQAERDPAFGKKGRLRILPLADSRKVFGQHFSKSFSHQGQSPTPALSDAIESLAGGWATALIALLLIIAFVDLSPVPRVAIALFSGASIVFLASELFAFRLYSPERYYSYGMRAAGMILLVNVLGFIGYRYRHRLRYAARNLVCAGTMLGMWLGLGDGIQPRNGLTINRRPYAKLYDYVATLPLNVRIASHPTDGDDIPYFAARATMGGYETLQPWLAGSWARQKQRAEDTLRAMYSTQPEEILRYAEKYGVTHFLVNVGRYRGAFVRRSATFAPLTQFTRGLLVKVKKEDLRFAQPPAEAVIFEYREFLLVSTEKLKQVWRPSAGP